MNSDLDRSDWVNTGGEEVESGTIEFRLGQFRLGQFHGVEEEESGTIEFRL